MPSFILKIVPIWDGVLHTQLPFTHATLEAPEATLFTSKKCLGQGNTRIPIKSCVTCPLQPKDESGNNGIQLGSLISMGIMQVRVER